MTKRLRLDMPHASDSCRWLFGVLVSSRCTRLSAALVAATHSGVKARVQIAGSTSMAIPSESVSAFRQLSSAGLMSSGAASPGLISTLRTRLAGIAAPLIADLGAEVGIAPSRALAVGVHGPGLWATSKAPATCYLALSDAARLAELTGLTVIDAFPARDLAQGGQGGPVTALAEWILLKHDHRTRLLLDLGRTVRMSYLPPDCDPMASSCVLSFDVGPGMRLLDLLAHRLTAGEHHFDPGGRLAVQGRRIPELVEHWLADPYFERPLPRWHPRGVRPERFLTEALQMAVNSGWSVRDLLCSATHFIAETIRQVIRRRLPENLTVDEIIISGGGQQNGMLLREIAARLPEITLTRIAEIGISGDTLSPAAIAVMALLHLDQVPANHTAITGAEIPRVLGRLTPGSPQNWLSLLHRFSTSEPEIRPLHKAS